MHAIITGATGFIGVALTKHLIQDGHDVTAVIRPDSNKKENLLSLIELTRRENYGKLDIL